MTDPTSNGKGGGELAALFALANKEAADAHSASAEPQTLNYKVAITGLAALTGGDADAILTDYERGGPLAEAIGRFLGIVKTEAPPGKRRGRPTDMHRDYAIYSVVKSLIDDGLPRSQAVEKARHLLFKQNIHGKGKPPGPLTGRAIERAMDRSHRIWLDPLE